MGRSKTLQGPYLNKEGKSRVNNNYTVFPGGNEEEPGRGHNGFFYIWEKMAGLIAAFKEVV